MELAGELDGGERLTVGQRLRAQRRIAGGNDLVGGIDIDGQGEVKVVGRRDLDLDRTNAACLVCLHGLNGQNQLAVFHLRAAGVVAVI